MICCSILLKYNKNKQLRKIGGNNGTIKKNLVFSTESHLDFEAPKQAENIFIWKMVSYKKMEIYVKLGNVILKTTTKTTIY